METMPKGKKVAKRSPPRARSSVHAPSRAQMAKDERKWRAESMVRDAFMQTSAAKQQIVQAENTLKAAEKKIQTAIKVQPKKGS